MDYHRVFMVFIFTCIPTAGYGGEAVGEHLDPGKTGQYLGPYKSNTHLENLSALTVEKNGTAKFPILAPRFKVQEVMVIL